jgi:hypothetical protein
MVPGVLVATLVTGSRADAQAPDTTRRTAAAPTQVQLSADSGYDAIASTSTDGKSAPSNAAVRLRAEMTHGRASRRGSIRVWAGATADRGVRGMTGGTLAEAVRVDAVVQLSRRSRIEFVESASRSPLDLFTVFGSVDPSSSRSVVRSSSELARGRVLVHDSRLSLTRTAGPRTSIALSAEEGGSSTEGNRGTRTRSLEVVVSRKAGPSLAWHAGYGLAEAASADVALKRSRTVRHDIDAGLDYSRPLPFWQHTTATFDSGSALLSTDRGLRFRLNLTAGLERRLSTGWTARAEFNRPIQFVPGFAEPFLSDALRLSLAGRPMKRLRVTASAGYARGTVGFGNRLTGFTSSAGSVRVAREIDPEWRIEAEWNDARYRFGATPLRPASIPERFTRQGMRLRLVWSPAFAR